MRAGTRAIALAIAALVVALADSAAGQGNSGKNKDKIDVSLVAPAGDALYLAPASVRLVAAASAKQKNHPIVKVEFFAGSALIGAVPGPDALGQYAFDWTGIPAGMYSLTARATNDKGDMDVSAPVAITVDAAPTVSLTGPANNAVFTAPAAITVSANASDSDGTVAKVDFYQGATLLGTAAQAPYRFSWTNVGSGTYQLTAVATDDAGAATTSSAVTVRVNAAPSISLTAPANGASFTAPASIPIAASAVDTDGTITKVEFFRGGTLIATLTAPPYDITLTGVPQGSYVLTAVTTDDLGASVTSDPVTVTVKSGVKQVYYIFPDHLNTPRVITDQNQKVVWRWDQTEPFGSNPPNEDPDNSGTSFTCNLRFPGQYFDLEDGLFYNYHRNYAPDLDRYVESDPVGIRGGINIYVYVTDPMTQIDPLGLMGAGAGANTPGPRTGFTGNILPGAPQQNFICDFPADLFLENNPCTQRCCVQHDQCFQRYKCNWTSWFGNIFVGGRFPCNQCNTVAKNCVIANWSNTSCLSGCGNKGPN